MNEHLKKNRNGPKTVCFHPKQLKGVNKNKGKIKQGIKEYLRKGKTKILEIRLNYFVAKIFESIRKVL